MIRPYVIDEEVKFDGRSLISETDLEGNITFINRKFTEMTGYTKEEAIGQPHSLIRHPDMPKAVFEQMWKVIQERKTWEGYVKNLRKDGKYYWVSVHIISKKDKKGKMVGYIASRKIPDENRLKMTKVLYAKMIEQESLQKEEVC